ncbi:Fis family transcriptional regulator [Photobacterium frigidiphilum]|uniref:Putative Fis-like DNA-binding protein n=1 Tax=Photobacterium frigidiphilum TaxID=264736 RepID=A0A2T3JA41_9GAMM|nr:helix-turn-helix domain-containing protein [Photobacterium frigidiphilum]PSU45716.1 Fis family transcriptional regulator [Photobacterium frigidiphilum]
MTQSIIFSSKKSPNEFNTELEMNPKTIAEQVKASLKNYLSRINGPDVEGMHAFLWNDIEHELLDLVLQHTRGNQSKAARLLGINRGTLRTKLEMHNLA